MTFRKSIESREAVRPPRGPRPGEPLERRARCRARRPPGRSRPRGRVSVGAARAEQTLVAEGLAATQIEDRLELDEELPAGARRRARAPRPAARPAGSGIEVADRVPLRLRGVLRRHPHVLRQRARALGEVRRGGPGSSLDERSGARGRRSAPRIQGLSRICERAPLGLRRRPAARRAPAPSASDQVGREQAVQNAIGGPTARLLLTREPD